MVQLTEVHGDLWDWAERTGLPAVVPVNCVGVMGAGVAKQAAERYPGLLDAYRAHLSELERGMSVYLEQFHLVLFPTKRHWREASDLELIRSAARTMPVPAAVMPRVGCGLGRLDWSVVKSVLERSLPAGTWYVVSPVPGAMCLVVGTREPDAEQVDACKFVVEAAVEHGVTVLSGGADGIDSIAVSHAVGLGGSALSIVVDQDVSVGSVELMGDVTAEDVELVKRLHPNPDALTDRVLMLHVRNLRMVERLMQVRQARLDAGEDVYTCIVFAIPRWRGDEFVGGTAMTIRICEHFQVPCKVYKPGEGWYWHVSR